MSKWNRPMTQYRPEPLFCGKCGEPVRPGEFGGWVHVKPLMAKDPTWHRVGAAVGSGAKP